MKNNLQEYQRNGDYRMSVVGKETRDDKYSHFETGDKNGRRAKPGFLDAVDFGVLHSFFWSNV